MCVYARYERLDTAPGTLSSLLGAPAPGTLSRPTGCPGPAPAPATRWLATSDSTRHRAL